jgi:hypothetical protein
MQSIDNQTQPDDAQAPEVDSDTFEGESQFLSALKLFEMGRVTTSQAAEMCGMASVDFLLAAERSNQPVRIAIRS